MSLGVQLWLKRPVSRRVPISTTGATLNSCWTAVIKAAGIMIAVGGSVEGG